MIFQALPIPISLITILGSIISLANIGVMIEQSLFVAVVATIFMILAGTYSLTYIFSADLCYNGVSKKTFLREEGGTRSVTEGARATLDLY